MAEDFYTLLKQRAQEESRANGACKQGYHDLLKAEDIGQFAGVLRKYQGDILGMHKESTLAILEELYPEDKEQFNRLGIYYNEDSETGMVIVNNTGEKTIHVGGDAVCHAYGDSHIIALWSAKVYAHNTVKVWAHLQTQVQLFDMATAHAYGRSQVDGNDTNIIYAYDACIVNAGGSTVVHATSWNRIATYGDAVVYAPTKRKIKGNVVITKHA